MVKIFNLKRKKIKALKGKKSRRFISHPVFNVHQMIVVDEEENSNISVGVGKVKKTAYQIFEEIPVLSIKKVVKDCGNKNVKKVKVEDKAVQIYEVVYDLD